MRGRVDREAGWRGVALGVVSAAMILLCGSCRTFVPEVRDPGELGLPEAFDLFEQKASPVPDRWWELFGSEELNALVEQAMGSNLTLQQVYARMMQAEMAARKAGASRFPTLTFSAETSVSRRHTDTGESVNPLETATDKLDALNTLIGVANPGGAVPDLTLDTLGDAVDDMDRGIGALKTLAEDPASPTSTSTSHSYEIGLGSSYEVDLWGRVRAQHQAAILDAAASLEDMHAAMLSLSGAVVQQWVALVGLEQEAALVEKQLELNRTTLELMKLRWRKGMATALDVLQQRQVVARTESLIPPLESDRQLARYELASLLGRYPGADLGVTSATLPEPGPLPDPGLPAELLARRPDVRAAGMDLQAADWRVSAARADRLPALRLTGSAGYGADNWELVLNNWMATLAGSITGPIFDAGQRKAEVERTKAVVDERLAAYRDSVVQAMKEVESALCEETKQAEYITSLQRELDAARASHEQALERFRKGLNDYLPVLSALTDLQVLERSLVRAERTRLEQRVQLCLSLGGRWMAAWAAEQPE